MIFPLFCPSIHPFIRKAEKKQTNWLQTAELTIFCCTDGRTDIYKYSYNSRYIHTYVHTSRHMHIYIRMFWYSILCQISSFLWTNKTKSTWNTPAFDEKYPVFFNFFGVTEMCKKTWLKSCFWYREPKKPFGFIFIIAKRFGWHEEVLTSVILCFLSMSVPELPPTL